MNSPRFGFDPENDGILPPPPDVDIRGIIGLPPPRNFDHLMTAIESSVLPTPEGANLSDEAQFLADAVPAFRMATGLYNRNDADWAPRDAYQQLSDLFSAYAEENTALKKGALVETNSRQGLYFVSHKDVHGQLEIMGIDGGETVTGTIAAVHIVPLPRMQSTRFLHELANGKQPEDADEAVRAQAALRDLDLFTPAITLTRPGIYRDGIVEPINAPSVTVPIWEWLRIERFSSPAAKLFRRNLGHSAAELGIVLPEGTRATPEVLRRIALSAADTYDLEEMEDQFRPDPGDTEDGTAQ